jgi:hypothetical protein
MTEAELLAEYTTWLGTHNGLSPDLHPITIAAMPRTFLAEHGTDEQGDQG